MNKQFAKIFCLSLLVTAFLTLNAAAVTVTNNADSGAGSLRQAIAAAATGEMILFAPDITSVVLTTGEITIDKSLTIDGGANGVTISSNNASHIFRIWYNGNVALRKLTVTDGYANDPPFNFEERGGCLQNRGNLSISDSIVSDCENAGNIGGGIANYWSAVLTINNSVIRDNSSVSGGGGIYNGEGGLTVTGTLFSGNSGTGGGGAIYNLSRNFAPTEITNCTFINNSSPIGKGSAIYQIGTNFLNGASNLTIANSLFNQNNSDSNAGCARNFRLERQ